MEWNEMQRKLIDKANFYFEEKLNAHVLIVPKGKFKNGLFKSKLINDKFFWFIELESIEPIRIFLSEIHDIEDYKERVK